MTAAPSTLSIRDRTAECSDRECKLLSYSAVRVIAIHRLHLRGVDIADDHLDAPTMCREFQANPKLSRYTGKQNPYALLIRAREGMIEQCTPLLEMGAHAGVWNDDAIGIAVVGDFRTEHPTSQQWHRAMLLAATLSQAFEARILGHDELAGGSRDKAKECPGRLFPMPAFRAQIRDLIRNNRGDLGTPAAAHNLLARAGARYGG